VKTLKIVQAGWENFTGWLGPVYFEGSVSIEPTTDQIANQLCGIVSIEEVLEDGSTRATGVTQGMVEGKGIAYVETPLVAVSSAEAEEERRIATEKASRPPVDTFNTVEELEAIATESGINGLRTIGNVWNVRERSIPKLIKLILEAQEEFKSRLKGKVIAPAEPAPEDEEVVETTEEIKE